MAISREDYEAFWCPLAYFFGAWLGDGWYSWNPYHRNYSIGIKCMDKSIVEKCFMDVTTHFDDLKDPGVYEEMTPSGTNLYKIVFYNKIFTDFIAKATAYKTEMPAFIWDAPKETKLDLLAGLMDTDGTILKQKSPKRKDGFFYRLTFSGTKGFVSQFPDLCRVIGIKLTGAFEEKHSNPKHALRTIFSISLPSALENGFRFYCERKQKRLEDAKARSATRYQRASGTKYGVVPSETIRPTA